ncbi:MAG: hypothetical protein Q7R91_00185 [bacterium]|nr:hypothetical protein [bacterium]
MKFEGAPQQPTPEDELKVAKKETPSFIRDFSRENSADERREMEEKIRGERKKYFEGNKQLEELGHRAEELNKTLDTYNDASFLRRVKDYFKLRSLKAELGVVTKQEETLGESLKKDEVDRSAKVDIQGFYEQERKKWEDAPYSKEDIQNNFSEKNLASLSMEDYVSLLRRFPSEMVTHVTRQGIRDHANLVYHQAGVNLLHNGFARMLEDGNLKSPLGVHLAEENKLQAVGKFLEGIHTFSGYRKFETKQEAETYLDRLTSHQTVGTYADMSAIHFAAEEVADGYYGSERGNEVFVAFPAAFVASQYYFGGSGELAERPDDAQHNDKWVWTSEERGIDLDAGIVFIPKNARVDSKTGSRYQIDSRGNPIVNAEKNGYKISETTISSQEYWEEYLKQHPDQRPSKIVYYEGDNPTKALNRWRKEQGLTKKSKEENLGFSERHISPDSEIATSGMDRFKSLALEAIDRNFLG